MTCIGHDVPYNQMDQATKNVSLIEQWYDEELRLFACEKTLIECEELLF